MEHPILYSTPMIRAKLEGRKTQTRRIRGLESVNSHQGKALRLIGDSRTQDFPRPAIKYDDRIWFWWSEGYATFDVVRCPYKPGDILWSRETFCTYQEVMEYRRPQTGSMSPEILDPVYAYMADGFDSIEDVKRHVRLMTDGLLTDVLVKNDRWYPSIHQPKIASRIWERITNIRVERLQDISPGDACDEGIEYFNVDAEAFRGGELQADFMNYTWRDDPEYEDYHFPMFANPIDSYRELWESINGEGSWNANPWVWAITTEILSTTGRPKEL